MEELYSFLRPYSNWFRGMDEDYNKEAKQTLQAFYIKLKNMKPDKTYQTSSLHVSYIDHLVRIRKAIIDKKYVWVCNELESLIHYEPILQGRIYYNLINILEDGLEIEGDQN